jgi:porin
LKLGGYFNGGSVAEFGSTLTSHGRYGFYVLGDQVLVRWGSPAENRHLGIFASFVFAPDQSVNKIPYFFDAGVLAYGPLASRPADFIALGAAYGAYSSDLRSAQRIQQQTNPSVAVQSYEMTLELSCGWRVRPGLLVQPALQCIVHPGGKQSVPNAIAIGANIVMNF